MYINGHCHTYVRIVKRLKVNLFQLIHFVVSPMGSVMISPSGNILASFNSTVNITCSAGGGPNNMFEWSKQGAGVVSNNSVLEFSMITGTDGAVYECTVTNAAGSDMASALLIGMHYCY